ncbi:mannonate dehydratase [Shimia abyssi]|uniref:Mannonate dehydratase n=1 Tax=Shimia abyssi TaxID=1662395 RepID=A0A2P8F0Z5_9RHOB|nr:mannonate dehydratase [Shimia abyssi]PSL15391.1 D-mannonate dehydratase [Shimia abyssi]
MKQTWRWFGPSDMISIGEIRQTGATGIVSALHHVPPGEIWSIEQIKKRQQQIERPEGVSSGLTWDVVESVPVSEAIKSQTGPLKQHLAAYKQCLRNLAECGIHTICYNFMPVLDWTRTNLCQPLPHGGHAMRFELVDFVAFDCFILCRKNAERDYSDEILQMAQARFANLSDSGRQALSNNIVAGLPGANDNWSLADVKQKLATYEGMGPERLRSNLIDFLSEVVPTAETLGIRLCCHPDDPPFSLLGLPRVMSSQSDYATVLNAVESPSNGATLCTGSLGVATDFNPVSFIAELGHKIHFVHLRNTVRDGPSDCSRHSFTEAEHLAGDTNMVATIRALLAEEQRRRDQGRIDHDIPMRPDHGHALLSDLEMPSQPGYPLVGRLRGLAELRGVILGCA